MKKVLILGGSGQDGYFLTRSLLKKKINVVYMYRSKFNTNGLEKEINNSQLSLIKNKNYDTSCMESLIREYNFSEIVLISGAIGNAIARKMPLTTYKTNIDLGLKVIETVMGVEKNKPKILYFTTIDTNSCYKRDKSEKFNPETYGRATTTYGASKQAVSSLLSILNSNGTINATNLYLGMHESWKRDGDYFLTKIKRIIQRHREGSKAKQESFGNLNVQIDIGHAPEYMAIVAEMIFQNLVGVQEYCCIGSGRTQNLRILCEEILREYNIDPKTTMNDIDNKNETCYPYTDVSIKWENTKLPENILNPSPLNAKMLKKESQCLRVH